MGFYTPTILEELTDVTDRVKERIKELEAENAAFKKMADAVEGVRSRIAKRDPDYCHGIGDCYMDNFVDGLEEDLEDALAHYPAPQNT